MRHLVALLLVVLALAVPAVAFADNPTHVVAYGETLYSIARQYAVSPAALAAANGITTQSWVYAGQRLVIPAEGSTASVSAPAALVAQPSPSGTYVVRAGDTLSSLSRKFGIPVSALAVANDIPPNGFLYSGWQLKIPGAGAQASASQAGSKPPAPALDTSNQNASSQVAAVSNKPPAKNAANNAPAPGILAQVMNVPLYRQEQTLTCEESAAAMALRGALTEAQIVAAMPRSDNPFEGIRGDTNYELIGGLTHYGTYAQGLQKGLAALGRQSTTYYGQSYEQFKASIIENLKQGRPVIWWTTRRESPQKTQWVQVSNGTKVPLTPYEHTVVIVSYTDKGVNYHDPADGTVRFTSWANHQRTSGYFNNMALVIY